MNTQPVHRSRLFQAISVLLLCLSAVTSVFAGGRVAAWGDNAAGQTQVPNNLANVKTIGGGSLHSVALRADGTVVAWGQQVSGYNSVPFGLSNVAAIAVGEIHNLALTRGTVVAWGFNENGLSTVPVGLSNVTAIAAGGFGVALKSDGTVVALNTNAYPVPAGLSNIVAVAAGWNHVLALRSDGTIAAWGDNLRGQCNIPTGLTDVTAISGGASHSLALRADGTVVAWGYSLNGETNVPLGLSNVTAIAAGGFHNLTLKADGTVVAWGDNGVGQCNVPAGASNITSIAAGAWHSLALVSEGPVQILEQPQSQLVRYTSNATFSVAATGFGPLSYQWQFNGNPLFEGGRASGVTNASLTITNLQFSDSGTYRVVVSNAFGSVVSTDAVLTVYSPPFITQQPLDRTVRAGSDVTFIATADGTSPLQYQWYFNGAEIPGAIGSTLPRNNVQSNQSGLYHLRVTNIYGEALTVRASLTVTDSPPYFLVLPISQAVGIGGSTVLSTSARGSTPLGYQWRFNGVDIPGATNPTLPLNQMRYDQAGYYNVEVSNAFGLTNSPKVFVNVSQVLVTGSTTVTAPTPNFGTNIPPTLSNVTAVAAGAAFVMALKSDGTVRTWLEPALGIPTPPPGITNVPTLTNLIAIAAGYDHCLALRSNGTVHGWGGTSTSPISIPPGLSNVVAIAAGQNRSYAIKTDGTVTGWGSQQLPNGLSNIVSMVCKSSQNFALRRDGSVISWPASSGTFSVLPALSNIIALTTSSSVNLALRQDGTVWKWSSTGTPLPVLSGNSPQSNIVAIATGTDLDMLLRSDGTLLLPNSFKRAVFTITNNIAAIATGGGPSPFGVTVIGNGAPTFTLQPVSQIVQRSNTVQLHARVVGTLPMTYQWLRDGLPLSGATNHSLTLSNFTGASSGSYQMIAANALGTAASRIATISIPFNTNLAAALNLTNREVTNPDRSALWFAQNVVTHDGDVAAQSGATTNNGISTLQTYLSSPGTLTFWWKVSSEEGFDYLRVYLGQQSTTPLFTISGETDWEQKTIVITNSQQFIRWVYSKDGSVSAGRDAGFLDEVKFTVPPPVISITPSNQTVNAGANVSFFATTLSYDKPVYYQWMLYGTNLVNATNQTLSLTNVGRANQGSYSVWATNSGGSTLASNTTLNVIVPQQLSSLRRQSDGGVELLSRDADGRVMSATLLPKFEAQVSSNLVDWVKLPNALTCTNGSFRLCDPEAGRWPQRFYRVVEH